jgi:hypothetical protein
MGLVDKDSDCQSAKKVRKKRQKRKKGLAEMEIDWRCAGRYCSLSALSALKGGRGRKLSATRRKIGVVCVIRALLGWNVRLKRPNGYTDFVALAAKSFVS